MIEGVIPTEIAAEGDAIRATLTESLGAARDAARALREAHARRVYLIGNGTSYHSALAASTWYRRLARADEAIVIPLPAGEFRHYLPALGPGDAVVGISASGEFRDVVAAFEALRGRVPTAAIVHVRDSSLERVADRVVRSGGGPSNVPVMTKTFAATLTGTILVLAELLGGSRADAACRALAEAGDQVDRAVADAVPVVPRLADELAGREHVFVVGSGNAAAAAFEAALKLKETALVHAEGAESWEMASGGATIVDPDTVVIALAPEGPGREATLDVARHAAGWGARVVEVGPGAGPSIEGADLLRLPDGTAEDMAPLTAVAPVALLAYALARRSGLDPDHPHWVERYHSQGLRHIVGVGKEDAR